MEIFTAITEEAKVQRGSLHLPPSFSLSLSLSLTYRRLPSF